MNLIPFKRTLSFWQFIPSKQACLGIKFCVLADAGNCFVFKRGHDTNAVADMPLCTRVVQQLVEGYKNIDHHLYVDNFYTSHALFTCLMEHGIKNYMHATLPLCISSCSFELWIPIERHWLGMHIIIFSSNGAIPLSAFEITLVRLSETSNNLPGQAISPVAVIRRTSDMHGKNSAAGRKSCISRLSVHMLGDVGVLIAVNIVPVQPF